jgi:probable addiction module antidote protein
MPKRTRDYHSWQIKQLTDPQTAAGYLNAALNDSNEMFLKALRNVAEAGTIAKVAKKAGVRRESLYRTLSDRGNPRFDTLNSVLSVLGLRMGIQPRPAPRIHGRGMVAITDRALDMRSGTGNLSLMARDVGKLAPAPAKLGGEGVAPGFQAGLGAYPQGPALPQVPGQGSGHSFRLVPEPVQMQIGLLEDAVLKAPSTHPQAYADSLRAFASSMAQQTL